MITHVSKKYLMQCGTIAVVLLVLLAALPVSAGTPAPADAKPVTDPAKRQVAVDSLGTYGQIPLFFIRNEGQVDGRIRYYERGQGHATLFTRQGLILNLAAGKAIVKGSIKETETSTHSIAMSFRQANPEVEITARDVLPTRVNLFQGNDPANWHTGIQTYAEIDYRRLYDGIDARFYGKGGTLEYDMVVAPGAYPDTIEIGYDRIQSLRIAADGSLEIDLGDGILRQSPPIAYQEIDGQRVMVPAAFRLISDKSKSPAYGFTVAEYDRSRPLIIDPSIVYSSYFGGGLDDIGYDITADDEEQAFVVGETTSTDLLPVAGFNGGTDVFLVQLNRQGNVLLVATYIGGSGIDRAYSVVHNNISGTIIISGETQSTNFPIVNGFQTSSGGTSDVFVLDYDPVGDNLLYSTYMGGSGIDLGWDVADGGNGVIYIAGETRSMDFPVTLATAYQSSYGGSNKDGFFAKIDTKVSGAGSLVYSSYLGVNADDAAYSVDVDSSGNVIVGGYGRQQFPTTANAYQTAFGGQQFDGFISKFDLTVAGSAGMLYSSFFGANNNDQVLAVRVDPTDSNIVYLAGDTASTNLPLTASAFDSTLDGTLDAFVAKIDISQGASGLLYSSYLGGDGTDSATGVDANTAGNLYVSGVTYTPSVTTLPTTADAFQSVFGGGASDGFFSVFDTSLSGAGSLVYSTLIGGNGADEVKGMFITQSYGQAYLTGSTTSSLGFPIQTGPYNPYQNLPQGGTDAFVMRLAFIDNTPTGTGVVAPFTGDPAEAVIGGDITFNDTVTGGGSTWIVDSTNGPQEQPGFKFGSPPVYYYLESTVSYTGTVEVCFDYNETKFSTEQSLKLQYWNGSGWDNITVSLDTTNNRICGVMDFSTEPLAISEPDPAAIPVMSYSTEAGYDGSDGVDPDSGNTNDQFTYKVVYANAANVAPNLVDVCIDGFCYNMSVDSSASASLHDGDYSNGEQYIYITTLAEGTHNYYFVGGNDAGVTPLPAAGNLSGPVVAAVVNNPPVGVPLISGTVTQGQLLNADTSGITDADGLGTFSYQWLSDGSPIAGATGSSYTLTQAEVGTLISVQVSYTDGQGTLETVTSAETAAVANSNDLPVGEPLISGIVIEGEVLSADTSGISDADGLGTFSYQWLSDGSPISGATGSTYTLTQAEVGTLISVEVSYTDGQGTPETVTSAETVAVTNANDPPVGVPLISGTATQGQVLTADTSGISDADGLGTFSYQWFSDGSPIAGATGSSYTLTQAEVGTLISVQVSYTDGQGTLETVTSAETAAVANINDPPVGVPLISGTATQGQVLTADTSGISDADGLGTFSYQWLSDGSPISGATGSAYTLTAGDVGTLISVEVSYTDGQGTPETVTSAETATVTNANDPPVGVPLISGNVTQGQVLTADTSGISDADGLGTFSYQWLSDGSPITGATGSTYTLTQAEVGTLISVQVSYTDGQGTFETLISAETAAVANINDPPVGVPLISGNVTQGQVLTADTSGISDADGLGTFGYQWLRDGSPIFGATGSTYMLTASDVGTLISVQVSYTDGQGTPETVTSAETVAVSSNSSCMGGTVAATPAGTTVTISPHPHITMTFTAVSAAGDTCVTRGMSVMITRVDGYVFSDPVPTYEISTLSTYSGKIGICVEYDPTKYHRMTTLRLFHYNGSNWDDITTSLNNLGHVVCGQTSSLSPFAVGEEITTAISLMDFQALRVDGQTVIQWETQSEIDNWGFRILRSESATGPFLPLNDELIPARGGLGLSISYTYTDVTAEPGKQYYYQLQDIDMRGLMTAHDAVALKDSATDVAAVGLQATPGPGDATSEENRKGYSEVNAEQATGSPVTQSVMSSALVPAQSTATSDNRDHTSTLTAMEGSGDDSLDDQALYESAGAAAGFVDDAAIAVDDGDDPLHDMDSSLTGHGAVMNDDTSMASFSVTIKDEQGHVIDVRRVAEPSSNGKVDAADLTVSSSGKDTLISWQAGRLHARGFALYRSQSGKDDYQPLMAYIPNYGNDDQSLYQYRFTDHDSQAAGPFDYRLEVLSWGLKTVSAR